MTHEYVLFLNATLVMAQCIYVEQPLGDRHLVDTKLKGTVVDLLQYTLGQMSFAKIVFLAQNHGAMNRCF